MSAKRHKSSHSTDAVKLALMLSELRLPAMKQMWSGFAVVLPQFGRDVC